MADNFEHQPQDIIPPQAEYIKLKNTLTSKNGKRTILTEVLSMPASGNSATYSSYPYTSAPISSSTTNSTSSSSTTSNSTPLPSSISSSSSTTLTYKSLLSAMGSCLGRCVSKNTPHVAVKTSSCWRRQPTDDQEVDLMSNVSDGKKKDNFIYRIIRFKSKKRNQQFIDKFWEHNDMNYQKLDNRRSKESVSEIQLQNLDVNKLLRNTSFAKESSMNYAAGMNNCSSRASSSLDLEWEHEYSQMRPCVNQHQQNEILVPIHKPIKHTLTDNLIQTNEYATQDNNEDHSLHPPTDNSSIQNVPLDRTHTPKGQAKQTGCRHGSFSRNSSHNSWSHISTPESLEWDIDEDQQRQLRTEDDNLDHETLKLLHEIEQLKNQVLNETGDGLLDAKNDGCIQFTPKSTALHEHFDSGEIINIS